MRALILAPFSERALRRLRARLDVVYESWLESRRLQDPDELGSRLRDEGFDILVVEADFVFAEVFDVAPNLRFVGVCRNALNHVDLDAAAEHGVTVVHTPSRNAAAVAELTLGLMLTLARHIAAADRYVRDGEWRDPAEPYRTFRGREIGGSTVGVVGLGQIGAEVARRAHALGARVLAHDPFVTARRAAALGARLVRLADLMRRSDFVTLHLPLTGSTTGLISARLLDQMKPTAFLINTAAAAVVDYAALGERLRSGRLAGAALDVFEGHPLPPSSPLLGLQNVILTPHIGGATEETVERHSRMIAGDILRFLDGQPPRHPAIAGGPYSYAR